MTFQGIQPSAWWTDLICKLARQLIYKIISRGSWLHKLAIIFSQLGNSYSSYNYQHFLGKSNEVTQTPLCLYYPMCN